MVENSLKYAGDDITLHLECSGPIDKYHHLTYYDTGHGVSEEHLERIFERFYRVSEGRTRDDGGSGLGLSIVKGVLELHNAAYGVDSQVGIGSTFWFELDVFAPEQDERETKQSLEE